MDDQQQQQQSIIRNGSNDYHQPSQSSSQSFDQSMPSFTENSIGDVTMESVGSPSIQSSRVGRQDGSEQGGIADGAPIPIASKKRKRAEIAPSELRDLGLLPASRHASPSQSRSGSRAASPALASTSSAQINTNPSRDKSSAKKSSRNIDRVFFGAYEIKTWYYSPYPFEEEDWLAFNPSTKPEENRTNLSRRSSGKASENNGGGGGSKSSNKRAGSESSAASPSISTFNHSTQDLPTSPSSIGGALGSSVHEAPVLSNSVDNLKLNSSTNDAAKDRKSERKMWVCDGCFKYMRSHAGWNSHKKRCTFTHPPGKKVYQRGAHIIWEVDGAQAKLYAQNLSLFGKLFIDHKTIYFDVEPFTFYVLTDATTQFDHALGYFSKEKVSYDDYNLACIITFPPFQQKGFGTLMIEFSYYLSSLTDIPGTPERPLSDLGLKGYLSFWSSVVLRTLVIAFNDIESPSICLPYVGNKLQSSNAPASVEKLRIECLRIRRILLGLPPLSEELLKSKSQRKNSESNQEGMLVNGEEKPKRHSYGWAGEIKRLPSSSSSSSSSVSLDSRHLPSSSQNQISASTISSPSSSSTTTTTANQSNPSASGRTLRTRSDKGKEKAESLSPPPPISNINSTSQLLDLDGETTGSFQLRTNLERIAEATNLRLEDCSQALMECGLMSWKIPHENGAHENGVGNGIDSGGGGEGDLTLMISLDKVREGIRKKGVKRQMLDVNYVL